MFTLYKKNIWLILYSLTLGLIFSNSSWAELTKINRNLAQAAKPNFIFIAVDDLNIYNSVLGDKAGSFLKKVYPDDDVRKSVVGRLTPNLAKLAEQSSVFTKAYSASPLCGPSRTALLTGIPTHISGYYQHDKHFRYYDTLAYTVTLPQYLKKNGYYTAGIGKVFHKGRSEVDKGLHNDWADSEYSWSAWVDRYSGTGTMLGTIRNKKEVISKYWADENGKAPKFSRFGTTSVPTEASNDYVNAKYIADLIVKGQIAVEDINNKIHQLTRPKDQPFFLAAGIFAPHLPWVVEKKYFDLFPQSEMAINRDLYKWVQQDLQDLSKTGKKQASDTKFTRLISHGKMLEKEGDIHAWRAAFQAYLATIAYADRVLGILVDAIKHNPAKNNTVVVLWSDHGYHHGDKNWIAKTSLWEASNQANFMILDPRQPNKLAQISAPVSLQDIYPTIVSMANLKRPKHIHGYDLTPLLNNPELNNAWDKPVLNTYNPNNHALRTRNYRYIRFKNGDQELYDLRSDPMELNNLATNLDNQSLLKLFSKKLDKQLKLLPKDYF
ncbi:sulfatase [Catenovulum adriaticum]|uniref:Sulfatase n=1 Tax=Catenovulum adriaticum TaxID=2984846 RepID=A0ABY7AR52_9ALTE|nr:sulfatase [Catenovulum sp. TS8]WAJ71747.1 sulfatase [Catenovulum sp. TS8]